MWIELNVWGDSIYVELAWESAFNLTSSSGASCDAEVTMAVSSPSIVGGSVSEALTLEHGATGGDSINILLQSRPSDGMLVGGDDPDMKADQVDVTTTTSGATVVTRNSHRDVIVEVRKAVCCSHQCRIRCLRLCNNSTWCPLLVRFRQARPRVGTTQRVHPLES